MRCCCGPNFKGDFDTFEVWSTKSPANEACWGTFEASLLRCLLCVPDIPTKLSRPTVVQVFVLF